MFQICAVLSYSSSTSFISYAMLSMCTIASCSLCYRTSVGVIGVSFFVKSIISCLYFSTVCAIFYIFSFVVTSCAYAQSRMLLYIFLRFFSNLSVHYFSSSFSSVICSQITCKIPLTSRSNARLVESALHLD
jgi:hypothetical protein